MGLRMSAVAAVHIASALLALGSGAVVLLMRKGTKRHRSVGRLYVASMLATNITALFIYHLSGRFGPFHAAALVSLATVVPAFLAAVRRRPGWLGRHYFLMTFSYVGLLAAAVSEIATRLPASPFWLAVVVASLAVFIVGAVLVFANAGRVLSPFRATSPD